MSEVKAAQDDKRNGKPGFKNGKKQGIKPQQSQSLNSDAAVPMLRFGAGNNFDFGGLYGEIQEPWPSDRGRAVLCT
jgi:hypothetical protein